MNAKPSENSFQVRFSILHKIMLSVLVLAFAAVGVSTYFAVRNESKVLKKGLIRNGRQMARHLAASTESAFWSLNWVFVEKTLQDPAPYRRGDIIYVKVVKPDGEVYLANDRSYYGNPVDASLLVNEAVVLPDYPFPETRENGFLLVHPVSIGPDNWYVILGLSTRPINEELRALILNNIFVGVIVLLIGALCSFSLARSISRPLIRLSKITQDISDGTRNKNIRVESNDEVGLLSHSFNRMMVSMFDTERALKESNEQFLTVLDSICADIYVADMQTHEILFMNRNMQESFEQDFTGQICWKSFRQSEHPCEHCTNAKLVDAQGNPSGVEIWEGQNPLTQTWYINYDRAIRWADGRIVRLQIAMDVTARKAAEVSLKKMNDELEKRVKSRTLQIEKTNSELRAEIVKHRQTAAQLNRARAISEKANCAKSEFLANMSHELRTPLNHIIGFTELVVDKNFGDLNDIQFEYLNDVLGSSRHLLSLINDILDLSKVEAGHLELLPAPVCLPDLIKNSQVMIKEKAIKHGIQINTEIDALPKEIIADKRKLKQIIYNLLSNAAKFTPDGGKITIQGHREVFSDGLVITRDGRKIILPACQSSNGNQGTESIFIGIEDTGIGLCPDQLEGIFNPFEQVDSTVGRKYQGTGLGLSLSRSLVELHSGAIWAESEGDGCGSRFCFVIPTQQSPTAN